jgi:murein L,D-transpeptidase YcbB/YkuD
VRHNVANSNLSAMAKFSAGSEIFRSGTSLASAIVVRMLFHGCIVLAVFVGATALAQVRSPETDEQRDLRAFYADTRDRAVWVDARGRPTEDARRALSHLRAAFEDGLGPEDYRVADLDRQAAALESGGEFSAVDTADFDVELTAGMLRYFRHLHLGRVNPRALGFHLDHAAERHDFPALLRSALMSHTLAVAIDNLRPRYVQYRGLRQALSDYRNRADAKTGQIELALERLRWLPDVSGRRLIVVNIPMFQVLAWDARRNDGIPVLDMAVITGQSGTKTPVFAADVTSIVLNPYWNVPESIANGEILPAVRRDPDYLTKHHMEIVGEGPRSRIRQLPGPWNALGRIKFDLPNPFDVYLHGTPAVELFSRPRRDFSHGCVRVSDPLTLAEWALKGNAQWTRARIVAEIETGRTQIAAVTDQPVVVMFYMTAVADPETHAVRFADDVYGHDARLAAWLAARRGGDQ